MRPSVIPLLLASLLPGFLASPAYAHAILVDSTPAPRGHVSAGHLSVVFRFNSRIDAARSRLALVKPDGTTQRLTPDQRAAADLLQASAELAPGAYVLTWQVLATDGHITRGRVPFTADAKP